MPELKGTQTEQNLKKAFAGESMARNQYTYFAEQAKASGLTDIAEFFERLAINEREHARVWFNLIYGEDKTLEENLEKAIAGEHAEWTDMYVEFANEARKEGFNDIAKLFTHVKQVERNHERELLHLLKGLKEGNTQEEQVTDIATASVESWMCGYCGFTTESSKALEVCPLCGRDIIRL